MMLPHDEYGTKWKVPNGAFSWYGNFPVLHVSGNRVQSLKRALYIYGKRKRKRNKEEEEEEEKKEEKGEG